MVTNLEMVHVMLNMGSWILADQDCSASSHCCKHHQYHKRNVQHISQSCSHSSHGRNNHQHIPILGLQPHILDLQRQHDNHLDLCSMDLQNIMISNYIYNPRGFKYQIWRCTNLSGWHSQMTHFGVYRLVSPFNIWPGQGFYVDLFWLIYFPLSSNQNRKGYFPDVSSEKKYCSAFAQF